MTIAYKNAECDEVLLYVESLDIDRYLTVQVYMDALL